MILGDARAPRQQWIGRGDDGWPRSLFHVKAIGPSLALTMLKRDTRELVLVHSLELHLQSSCFDASSPGRNRRN